MTETHLSREQLYDQLDGRGDEGARAHLDACPGCRRRLLEAEALLAWLSSLPREIDPPEWVWTGLAERMASGDDAGAATRRSSRRTFLYRAAAVLVLGAAGAAGLHRYRTGGPDGGPASGVPERSAAGDAFATSLRGYEEASAALAALYEERASTLPPETRRTLAKSLAELDRAIVGVREALSTYPNQLELRSRLSRTYQWKIKMLERAVRRTTEL